MRSASSTTRNVQRLWRSVFSSTMSSMRRPGVATTASAPRLPRALAISYLPEPPKTATTPRSPRGAARANLESSRYTCSASSRVGTRTRAAGPSCASQQRCAATCARSGQPNASVLPPPVSATASTSWPHRAAGTARACTAVGFSRPARATCRRSQPALGAAPNMLLKDGAALTWRPSAAVAEPPDSLSAVAASQAFRPPGTRHWATSSYVAARWSTGASFLMCFLAPRSTTALPSTYLTSSPRASPSFSSAFWRLACSRWTVAAASSSAASRAASSRRLGRGRFAGAAFVWASTPAMNASRGSTEPSSSSAAGPSAASLSRSSTSSPSSSSSSK
mmetsp:Transcript_7039/g.20690  ORF Transcript_7039/g.20690 Transcript_7039/m.20690 type:complete len:335 (+) Transcript_7039:476-1480(+)